jgi:hypothetical protein
MNQQDQTPAPVIELLSAPEESRPSLPRKQEAFLAALLTQPTIKAARVVAGISEATGWRYMQDERFADRLRETQRELSAHAMLRLQAAATDAVQILHDIGMNQATVPAVRVTSARALLAQWLRAFELTEVDRRLDDLERFILRKQEEDALDRAAAGDEEGQA